MTQSKSRPNKARPAPQAENISADELLKDFYIDWDKFFDGWQSPTADLEPIDWGNFWEEPKNSV